MKNSQIIIILFLLTNALNAQVNLDESKKMVNQGKLLLGTDKKEAMKTFDNAVRNARTKLYKEGHPEIMVLIGDAYMNYGFGGEADIFYTRARDIEPREKKYADKLYDPRLIKWRKEHPELSQH